MRIVRLTHSPPPDRIARLFSSGSIHERPYEAVIRSRLTLQFGIWKRENTIPGPSRRIATQRQDGDDSRQYAERARHADDWRSAEGVAQDAAEQVPRDHRQ